MPLPVKSPLRFSPRAPLALRQHSCAALAGSALWLSGATLVEAHPESSPGLVNRYVTAAVHGAHAEVAVALLYGNTPGADLRREADVDSDGQLDSPESAALASRLERQARAWLEIRVNDAPVAFSPRIYVDWGNDLSVHAAPVVVEARTSLPAADAPEWSLRLAPGPPLPRQGETEVTLALGEGWSLRTSQESGGPLGSRHSFKTHGPDTKAVRFTLARTSVRAPKSERPGWLVAPLAVGVAALAWWAARRRQRSGIG